MGASFLHQATNAFLGIGLIEVPADYTHGKMLDIIRKKREVISQLKLIMFINLHSIKADEFQSFWIETIHVVGGLNEQVT